MGLPDHVHARFPRGTRSPGGGPHVCRKVVRACSQPQGMFLHFETWRSGVGECAGPGEVPPLGVDSVPSGRNGADPEPPFQRHLPHLVVTVLPPYDKSYIAGVLWTLISQSLALRVATMIGRPGRDLSAQPLGQYWRLPLWGQDPTGRGSAAQSVKKPELGFNLLLFGCRLLRLGCPWAAS